MHGYSTPHQLVSLQVCHPRDYWCDEVQYGEVTLEEGCGGAGHMGTEPNLPGQIALGKGLVWTRILAPKVALSPRSGYSPGDTQILVHVGATAALAL